MIHFPLPRLLTLPLMYIIIETHKKDYTQYERSSHSHADRSGEFQTVYL